MTPSDATVLVITISTFDLRTLRVVTLHRNP